MPSTRFTALIASLMGLAAAQAINPHQSLVDTLVSDQVLLTIEQLRNTPSCQNIAAADLLQSCRQTDVNDNQSGNPKVMLETIKSVFAIRLAICEFDGTDTLIPEPCHNLFSCVPDTAPTRYWFGKKAAAQDETKALQVNDKQMGLCKKGLKGSTTSWMSYSNSLQNAQYLCQAARSGVERDQILAMIISSLQTAQASEQAQKETTIVLEEARSRFSTMFNAIQEKVWTLVQDAGRSADDIRQEMADLVATMNRQQQEIAVTQRQHQAVSNDLTVALLGAQTDVRALVQLLGALPSTVEAFRDDITTITFEVISNLSLAVTAQTAQINDNTAHMKALDGMVSSVADKIQTFVFYYLKLLLMLAGTVIMGASCGWKWFGISLLLIAIYIWASQSPAIVDGYALACSYTAQQLREAVIFLTVILIGFVTIAIIIYLARKFRLRDQDDDDDSDMEDMLKLPISNI